MQNLGGFLLVLPLRVENHQVNEGEIIRVYRDNNRGATLRSELPPGVP